MRRLRLARWLCLLALCLSGSALAAEPPPGLEVDAHGPPAEITLSPSPPLAPYAPAAVPKSLNGSPRFVVDARALVSSHGVQTPLRVVLHSTESPNRAGTSDVYGIASWWRSQGQGLGAHLTIDCEGNTALNIDPWEIGWHVASRNTGSVGIEQVGYARSSRAQWKACPRQLATVARWIAWLAARYEIPIRHDAELGVSTHYDQTRYAHIAGGHWDPGPGYPLADVLKAARQYRAGYGAAGATPILGDPTVAKWKAKRWARARGATETFVELADLYWRYAEGHGRVRPEVAYVQAAHETGYGRFGGVLDESFRNPAGLKTTVGGGNFDSGAHKVFASWRNGVWAQLDHLALYACAEGYPRAHTTDPRHFASLHCTARTVEALGGKWAPSPKYGQALVALLTSLEGGGP